MINFENIVVDTDFGAQSNRSIHLEEQDFPSMSEVSGRASKLSRIHRNKNSLGMSHPEKTFELKEMSQIQMKKTDSLEPVNPEDEVAANE